MVHFLIMKYRCIKRKNSLHSCSVVYSITIGYITQLHYRLKISMLFTAPAIVSVTEPPRNCLTTTIFGRKVNAWSDYLIRCIQSDDFHFVVPYCLYYSYKQTVTYCLYPILSWTHSSKGYFVPGPYFPRCTCLDIRIYIYIYGVHFLLGNCDGWWPMADGWWLMAKCWLPPFKSLQSFYT